MESDDPQSRSALQIVRDDDRRVFIRAKINHSSLVGFFRKVDINEPPFSEEAIPLRQRRRHQSVIANKTAGVDIQVYMLRKAQIRTVVKAAKAAAEVPGAHVSMELRLSRILERLTAQLVPQCATIPSGYSQHFDIPRCGWWRRKAVVYIVTKTPDETRVEGMVQLGCHKKLTVQLPVGDDGFVQRRPIADGTGGILEQVRAVILNQANASQTPTADDDEEVHGWEKFTPAHVSVV